MTRQPRTRRWTLPLILALPGLLLAAAGLFHPHRLTYETAERWWTLHVPGLLVFPLVGVALMVLVSGRRDPAAWAVRVAAYVYATCYTALDVVNGIAAGYVTQQLGPDVPRPDEIRYLFRVGSPLEDIGGWALVAACVAVVLDQVARRGVLAAGGLLLLPGAWLVRVDHIFSPSGVAGMTLIAAGTAALAWVQHPGAAQTRRTGSAGGAAQQV